MDFAVLRDLHVDALLEAYQPLTQMGKKVKISLFLQDQQSEWQRTMNDQEDIMQMMLQHPEVLPHIEKIMEELPDPSFLFCRLAEGEPIAFTEWFVLKKVLWSVWMWSKQMECVGMNLDGLLSSQDIQRCEMLLWKLNPEGPLRASFVLSSEYDDRLREKRDAVERIDRHTHRERERRAEQIEEVYLMQRNPFGEWIVKRGADLDLRLRQEKKLRLVRETAYDACYQLDEHALDVDPARVQLLKQINELEEEILRNLASFFQPYIVVLQQWVQKIIDFDLLWARVRAAETWNGVKPVLSSTHRFSFAGGIHPIVDAHLIEKGSSSTPIDFYMHAGAAVIVGPNMGGKTVALKTIGAIAVLGQMGFYVPALSCELVLFPWIGTVFQDGQQLQHGLSSYGAEITHLRMWMNKTGNGLLLLDEFGRSTNPLEGAALLCAVVRYFVEEKLWMVLVTHYHEVLDISGIQAYRIAGIALPSDGEIPTHDVISYLSKYMDYRLTRVDPGDQVIGQALLIARLLEFHSGIIDQAERSIEQRRGCTSG